MATDATGSANPRAIKSRNKKKAFINAWKEEAGCAYCDESHPAALDLHHPNPELKDRRRMGDKRNDQLANFAWDFIYSELETCVVICANCHRKLHWAGDK